MKKLALTSVMALALAGPAIAEDMKPMDKAATADAVTTSDGVYYTESNKTDFKASTLIGSRIYATTTDVADSIDGKAVKDWDDIGEINNIIIGRDGDVKAVVLGVGGFLGIGEKDVAVRMSELKFVKKAGDEEGNYFIVVKSDKAMLEKAPTYSSKKS